MHEAKAIYIYIYIYIEVGWCAQHWRAPGPKLDVLGGLKSNDSETDSKPSRYPHKMKVTYPTKVTYPKK